MFTVKYKGTQLHDNARRFGVPIRVATREDAEALIERRRGLLPADNYEIVEVGPTSDDPVVEAVIALWNRQNGWIPGAAYADLAKVLGVDPSRLIHYDAKNRRRHIPEEVIA